MYQLLENFIKFFFLILSVFTVCLIWLLFIRRNILKLRFYSPKFLCSNISTYTLQSFSKIICTHFLLLKISLYSIKFKVSFFSEGNLKLMHVNFLCLTEIIVTKFTQFYIFLLIQWQIQSTNASVRLKLDLIPCTCIIDKTCTCCFKTLSQFSS